MYQTKWPLRLHLPDAEGFRQFRIKSDMSVQFETDNNGTVTSLVLYRDKEKVIDTAPKLTANKTTALPTVDDIIKLLNAEKRKKSLEE